MRLPPWEEGCVKPGAMVEGSVHQSGTATTAGDYDYLQQVEEGPRTAPSPEPSVGGGPAHAGRFISDFGPSRNGENKLLWFSRSSRELILFIYWHVCSFFPCFLSYIFQEHRKIMAQEPLSSIAHDV
jgi:hypothetical protein